MDYSSRALLLALAALVGCSTSSLPPQVATVSKPQPKTALSIEPDNAAEQSVRVATSEPVRHTVYKAAIPPPSPSIPPVLLSDGHAKLCKVSVGEAFPKVQLPQLGGQTVDVASIFGKQATVVLYWHPDRWMARSALLDMQRDIAAKFDAQQVAVVGIAVRQPQGAVQNALNAAQAKFPQLLDTDGQAFAAVGTEALPRLFVLDPTGKIVWFDIEYSEATRRELGQTLQVLTKQ